MSESAMSPLPRHNAPMSTKKPAGAPIKPNEVESELRQLLDHCKAEGIHGSIVIELKAGSPEFLVLNHRRKVSDKG